MRALGDEAFEARACFRCGVGARDADGVETERARFRGDGLLDVGGIGQKSRSP
jgi:hypothetical protein